MADRVIALRADPGTVAGEFVIDIPRPRRPAAPAVREMVDELYAVMV
jgi:ABC-type nitrate/sulfonate/bicarbonate transport system ATPase subunit